MKKMICAILALTMLLSLTACGGSKTEENNTPAVSIEGTMEELTTKVIEQKPVEFMGGFMPVDLSDTSEDGLWAIKSFTGLDSAESLADLAVYEPMMGSIPFSLVMVRVAEGSDAKTVAEEMKANIDQRKWVCVEADDLLVAGYSDVVMLIMVGSDTGMTAQSYVDALKTVVGAEPAFVI